MIFVIYVGVNLQSNKINSLAPIPFPLCASVKADEKYVYRDAVSSFYVHSFRCQIDLYFFIKGSNLHDMRVIRTL